MTRFVVVLLVILGILAVIVGVIYLVEPTSSLPSFFPGHTSHGHVHHHIRGYIAIAVGIVLLVLAVVGDVPAGAHTKPLSPRKDSKVDGAVIDGWP